ncbi:MAG: hypothetical protein JWP26_1512 [Devosia sp.]|nr:hypothetical protein [Devosia sp.]MDB5535969.1 hypothetical protein [Devosia sp.]MDB5586542.1 hypothetical protein [Devosia sp.]
MRRAFAVADRLISLPRGWTVLALALASWGLLVLTIQIVSGLFHYVAAAF